MNTIPGVDISNDPVTGLKRTVFFNALEYKGCFGEPVIARKYIVRIYTAEGVEIENSRMGMYIAEVVVDNLTFVDAMGNVVPADTPGAVGAFDFVVSSFNNGAPAKNLLTQTITKADQNGAFDK